MPSSVPPRPVSRSTQSIAASCFTYEAPRNRIVLQDLDFPTNHYLFEGFRRYGADVVYVPSDDLVRAPIERLVDAGFQDRVMYGTDQLVWPKLMAYSIGIIQNADYLTPRQKRDILYNNAARFLRIDPAGAK